MERISFEDEILRMQTGPERQSEEPCWWEVSVGSLLYAAHATTPENAIAKVAESLDESPKSLVVVPTFVELYPDEHQPSLDEKFAEAGELVRLIPFSDEPFPEPGQELTAAQQEAFDRLA